MPDALFDPVPISYQGLFADNHLVDAQQFGKSIVGASKIANSICHEFFFGTITHDPRAYQIRFCVGPSKKNGLLQELIAIVTSGMPLYMPILAMVGKEVIQLTIKGMIGGVLNRQSDTKAAVEALHDIALKHAEFSSQVHKGHMRDKKYLYKIIDGLTRENRASLRELPEPIGKTVRIIQVGDASTRTIIDEPAAEVLRSRDMLKLGETVELDVKIEGVFKTNGACKVRLLDENKIVSGKITDPSLGEPHNPYTKALDEGAALHVVAQSTLKDGKLHKIYISAAEPIAEAATIEIEEPPQLTS